MNAEDIKKTLQNGGIEIYQEQGEEWQIAERIRYHMMDSGVRVKKLHDGFEVAFVARSQRSDFGSVSEDILFEKVRLGISQAANEHGFLEREHHITHAYDPVDRERVLDTWYEITYVLAESNLQRLVDEVRWAVQLDKVVTS